MIDNPAVPRALNRRSLLSGTAAVAATMAATGLVGGCSRSATSGGDVPAPAGPWSYTDDLGQRIDLPATPSKLAAYGDAAAALIHFGVRPVALFHYVDPAQDPTFEGLDLSGIEIIGTSYGEINVEKLAALAPDLVVTTSYLQDTADSMYGFQDAAQLEQVRALAPVIGIKQAGTALDVIKSNERLAAALGVDVDSGKVAADRTAFDAAAAALTDAAAGGLTVLPLYGEPAGLYLAQAPDDPGLAYYLSLGVRFVDLDSDDYFWEQVSWENADKYDADVILYSMRNSMSPDELKQQPVFARLAAARADQLHPWKYVSMAYPPITSYMTELTAWLGSDQKVTS